MLTQERLRELLDYDPKTGDFTWRVGRRGTARAGTKAGNINNRGYTHIRINNKSHKAHRLVFMYLFGIWPPNQIDHKDGNTSNNSFVNLRLASSSQNTWNSRRSKNNTTGFKGVHFRKDCNKFEAKIGYRPSQHLGFFTTGEAAHAAYCTAAEKLFGRFARFA